MKEKLSNSVCSEDAAAVGAASSEHTYEELTAAVAEGLEDVRKRLESVSCGRTIRLVAATKTVSAEVINYAVDNMGLSEIGENRVQELLGKYDMLHRDKLKIHFIGTLQTNKVKYIIGKVCLIHSLDSVALAREISRQSVKQGIVTDVLIEVNIGREADKGGIIPENTEAFYDEISVLPNIRIDGIMAMAPKCDKKEDYLDYFKKTYNIFVDISQKKLHNIDSPILSMGMSDSFECAAECGSTMVRVGSAIFGSRKQR